MRVSLYVIVVLLFVTNTAYTQCREFAKHECKPALENYAHDGNYNGLILSLGEEVELHKAFFSGQKYRIVICEEEHLPPVHFKVMNSNLEVLFDNKESNYTKIYDFELVESDTLIFSINFFSNEELKEQSISGCVVILFGMKM